MNKKGLIPVWLFMFLLFGGAGLIIYKVLLGVGTAFVESLLNDPIALLIVTFGTIFGFIAYKKLIG